MTPKTTIMKAFHKMGDYFPYIPMDEMMNIVAQNGGMVVDEAGNEWSGWFCGETGQATIDVTGIKGAHYLILTWYKMPSGRMEVIKYLT